MSRAAFAGQCHVFRHVGSFGEFGVITHIRSGRKIDYEGGFYVRRAALDELSKAVRAGARICDECGRTASPRWIACWHCGAMLPEGQSA